MSTSKKILWSIAAAVPSAAVGVVLPKVFQVWGIFDPFSEWLGGWLRMHVTPTQAEWTIPGILALLGYSVLLRIVWKAPVRVNLAKEVEPVDISEPPESKASLNTAQFKQVLVPIMIFARHLSTTAFYMSYE